MTLIIKINKFFNIMIDYKNNKMNAIPELEIGDKKELKKFEWTDLLKLIFDKEIKFTWRW